MNLEKLDELAARFDELETRLSQPETVADMDLFRRLMREHAGMARSFPLPRVQAGVGNTAQAREMLEDARCATSPRRSCPSGTEGKGAGQKIRVLLLPKTPTTKRT